MSTEATESLIGIDTVFVKSINEEQDRVIKKLEEVISILRRIEIKDNDKPLAEINEHVDDILSSLKYFPTDLSFDSLPTEIKTDIFSYLCNLGVFVASSVSQEWRKIMETRFNKIDEVTIGKHCSNKYQCEDNECFQPEEVLKASIILESDLPLSLCYPLVDVESDVIIEGLVTASSLNIQGGCSCVDIKDEDEDYEPILTDEEFDKLFKTLYKKNKVMNSVTLGELDLRGLNQNIFIDCLLKKTHSLTLDEGELYDDLINVNQFAERLMQVSKDSKLKVLNLYSSHYLGFYTSDYDEDRNVDEDFADAICNVYKVNIDFGSSCDDDFPKRLIDNVLNRPITLKKIKLNCDFDWRTLIEPDDLKTLIEKMIGVVLTGVFSPEQVEAVRVLPGVEASVERISKGEID